MLGKIAADAWGLTEKLGGQKNNVVKIRTEVDDEEVEVLKAEIAKLDGDEIRIRAAVDKSSLSDIDGLADYAVSQSKNGKSISFEGVSQLNNDYIAKQAHGFSGVKKAIDEYNASLNKTDVDTNKFVETIGKSNAGLGKYLAGLKGGQAGLLNYGISLVGATIKTVALQAATMALNAVLSMGISVAIQAAIAGIATLGKWMDDLIVTDAELSEKIKDIDTKWKELSSTIQNSAKAFQDLKAQADDIIPRYAKLSQGVDEFGNNVSLTDGEFKEFVSLNNQLGQMFPELVTGYYSNGNAILALSGNVDTLTESLYACVEAQRVATAQEIADTMPDVMKNITDSVEWYEKSIKDEQKAGKKEKEAIQAKIDNYQQAYDEFTRIYSDEYERGWRETYGDNWTKMFDVDISRAETTMVHYLQEMIGSQEKWQELFKQYEVENLESGPIADWEGLINSKEMQDALAVAQSQLNNFDAGLEKQIDDFNNRIASKWKQLNPVVSAWLSTDFLYQDMDTEGQNIVSKLIGEMDFKSLGLKTSEDVQNYISNNIISPIYDMDSESQKAFFEIFDIQDALKNGTISVEDYKAKIEEILSKGNFTEDFKEFFRLAFGDTDAIIENTTKNVDKMTVSLSDLSTASEALSSLSKAFKELNDDGYITTDTITKIKEATGLGEEEWKKYESTLLNAKIGSAEYNRAMSDLTYKILENKVGLDKLTEADEDYITAVLRENGVLNAEAVTADITANALSRLSLQKSLLNKGEIDTSADAEEILSLANAANVSAASIKRLERVVKYLKKAEEEEAAGRIDIAMRYRDKARRYLDTPIEYGETVDYSSSTKNEALDKYLKEAESRYKIHQNETKYIDDLNHALNNLVKTDEERLEITEKINEAYRDSADNRIKDIKHQIDLAKELNEYADVTDYYKQIQKVASEEESRLRAMGYDDNSNEIQALQKEWWDAQNKIADESYSNSERWINERNTYNDWELYDDNEIAAWERVLEKFKTEFPNELEKIKEIEQNIFEARKEAMEKSIDDIEDYIDARNTYNDWDAYGDSEVKAVQRITKIIEQAYRDRLLSYEEYIDELEEQTQRIYQLGQDRVDKHLSDIDKYIDARNFYNDWDDFGDTEINAIKRQLEILNEARKLNLISYEDYTEKYAEYTKKLYSVAKDNIIKETSKLIEDYEEMKRLRISRLESQKTLLQSYYDVTNAIAEAQHEINKELKASKTMYEYLNEDTRKLLFNQEDYNALSKELLEIQSAADELQKQYQKDILGANAETIAEITGQYQMQYETMMKQYEIAKAELEVAKKRQALDNVLAERNTRMFINGQWQWVAKTQDVINAQNELAEAEIEKEKQEASLEQTEAINSLTTQINSLETDVAQVRKYWEDAQEMLDGEFEDVAKALKQISGVSSPELREVIDTTSESITSFSGMLSESTEAMSDIIDGEDRSFGTMADSIGDIITDLGSYSMAIQALKASIMSAGGGGSSFEPSSIGGDDSSSESPLISVSDVKAQMEANSDAWHKATTQKEKDDLHAANVELGKLIGLNKDDYNSGAGEWNYHADGTRYTPGGLTVLGEEGFEAFISNNGHLIPINQPTIGNIGAGGIVFNREQMADLRNLWDITNLGKISPFVSTSNANSQNTVIDNSIHINGMTINEKGNEDWINGFRRYVATHK